MLGFAVTIFLGAFLLFEVQPQIGKFILPWFGGTPAVWSTCMLFFQLLLLAGYAYAHLLTRLAPRRQALLHALLLSASVVLLALLACRWGSPITPDAGWKPEGDDNPVLSILFVLSVSVGLPYFLLSTTGPLFQAWFAAANPTASPYRLYALSNIGSLGGLLVYPFLVEPALKLRTQGWTWSVLYAVYVAAAVACTALVARRLRNTSAAAGSPNDPPPTTPATATGSAPKSPPAPPPPASPDDACPTFGRKLLWLLLPATASTLLLAATNQVCQEVAVIPFLWVLPLTLYLLTFILAFGCERFYHRGVFAVALLVATGCSWAALSSGPAFSLFFQILFHFALLFVCCMMCHGELVRLKPSPRHLTSFYLMMSAGGALGGIFVTLLAPLLFNHFWEFHVAMVGTWVMMIAVWFQDPTTEFSPHKPNLELRGGMSRVWFARAIPVIGLLGLGIALYYQIQDVVAGSLELSRNFYGVLRVREADAHIQEHHRLKLTHGAILHGVQYLDPARKCTPASYYGPGSGVAMATTLHPARAQDGKPLKIGVLGLGVGTVAAFARPGEEVVFYEINPAVIQLAQGQEALFTYLSDCEATGITSRIILGDARLSMEREVAAGRSQHFDILVLDAFSSDAVPVHLMTREAHEIYWQELKPDGILVVHISNNHLDLEPVVRRLAEQLALPAVALEGDRDEEKGYFTSSWVVLTRNERFLALPEIAARRIDARPMPDNADLWTDDFTNLFRILKKEEE